MNDLIERLEKATEPNRELDRLIEETLPGVLRHPYDFQVKEGYVISGPDHPRHQAGQGYLPAHYTGSIDAALTLVPTAHEFEMWSAHLIECYWAVVISAGGQWKGKGQNPAIALCIAALRSRESH